ncbi:MAG: DUF1127 domain-containing protein [Rhizobiaceae bacterium]|nr:DUF1127 domain-containing protein [Rhizobiaceae bacterium]
MSRQLQPQIAIGEEQICRNPTEKSLLTKLLVTIRDKLLENAQRRRDHRAMQQLLELDERALRDIGLTRDDVYCASRLHGGYTEHLQQQRRFRSMSNMRSNS